MPGSCQGADVSKALVAMSAMVQPAAPGKCPKEAYCEERDKRGRPECTGNECRYEDPNGKKIPCPDHPDRPFGLDVAGGSSAKATKATKPGKPRKPTRRRPKKTAGRKKVTARKAPRRRAPKKAKKKTKR